MGYRIRSLHFAGLAVLFCADVAAAQTSPVPVIQNKPNGQQSISAIAISPDGAVLASARYSADGNEIRTGKNDSLDLWSLRDASGARSFATGLRPIRSLAFSHNSRWLAAASQALETIEEDPERPQILVGEVYLWHTSDSTQVKLKSDIKSPYAVEGDHDECSATGVAFSPDDKQLVADLFAFKSLNDYDVRTAFFDIATGRTANSTDLDSGDSGWEWRRFSWLSPDGRRAFVLRGNKPTLINTLNGRRVAGLAQSQIVLRPSDQDACDLGVHAFGFGAFSPDMQQVAAANDDLIEIRDARTGAIKAQTKMGQADKIERSLDAAFSSDGKTLAVSRCGSNSEMRLFESSTLQSRATLAVEAVQTTLQFTPDSTLLFTGGYDGVLRLWDTRQPSLIATLMRSVAGEWIVFAPDGLYDASAKGASLLAWRLNGQIVLASELADMRLPGLLPKLVSGERPKPNKPLIAAISHALPHMEH